MTEIPENVDLQWIGRTLLTMQRDLRERSLIIEARLSAIEMRIGRVEYGIERIEQTDFTDLRRRIEALERR
jgi:hypothetical protein